MSALACCFWWFLLGLLLGWLFNWLLSKWTRKEDTDSSGSGGDNYNGSVHSSVNAPSHASNNYSGSSTASGTLGAAATGAAAAHLMSGGADKALALVAGFKINGNDDIEIIEGIGPKIGDLFRENGAGSFDKIMNLSVPAMNAILEKGGSRFKLANPGSWAEQAKLCYENRWAELQTLQDSLSAGVVKSDSSNA
jgi:predicted flap endonuclease-1-like 5' DNA nuclease